MLTPFTRYWFQAVIRGPRRVLALTLILACAAGYLAIDRFEINSDTDRLIRQDTPWRQVYDDYTTSMPYFNNTALVVLSGQSPSRVNSASMALATELNTNTQLFESVFAPTTSSFLQNHALLYLDLADLDDLVSTLAEIQPALTSLQANPSLDGLFGLLEEGLRAPIPPPGIERLSLLIGETIDALISGTPQPVDWRDEMTGRTRATTYNLIIVKGRQDFSDSLPSARIIAALNRSIDALDPALRNGVTIRLTGQIPLDHGEIESAMSSAQMAGSIAVLLLTLVLVFGVRSLGVIIATYLAMILGLVFTAAFAVVSVGSYNTISIAFLVMYIGLGVDFAIHLCLRYQEHLTEGGDKLEALSSASTDVFPAVGLCALTSATGFLAFVPTNYTGLAELGIISAGGMFIAVLVSFSVIPAFFALTKTPQSFLGTGTFLQKFADRRLRQGTLAVTILITVTAAWIARDVYFDYSVLSLKDPDSEAMQAFNDLQREQMITDYSISYLAPADEDLKVLSNELLALQTVGQVRTPLSLIPADQSDKLYLLDDASILLASAFEDPESAGEPVAPVMAADSLANQLRAVRAPDGISEPQKEIRSQLLVQLERLLSHPAREQMAEHLQQLVMDNFSAQIDWLETALSVGAVDYSNLPKQLVERNVSADGRNLVSIIPAQEIISVAALERFVTEVTDRLPKATGRPVIELGIGKIVLDAFGQAVLLAILIIVVILYLKLRRLTDVLLIFIPLLIATILTFATSVVAGLPLNMANVIVIPLIFGLGVDNGIHVVERFRQSSGLTDYLHSSTPRAVMLSTLTTLGTFGALSFSSHLGIHSIGVLLTFALTYQLVLTLIVLPILLSYFSSPKRNTRVGRAHTGNFE